MGIMIAMMQKHICRGVKLGASNEEKLCTNKEVPEVRINFVFFIKQIGIR